MQLDLIPYAKRDPWLRFLSKFEKRPNGCWEWTGKKVHNGYGVFTIGTKTMTAHRYAWIRLRGPIPPKHDIDHLCRNRACVNPEHLEPVTRKENARRGIKGVLTTHCPQGHAYDELNTYIGPNGWRICRACRRERMRETYRRKAAMRG